jgi:primosomal protein N'
MVHILVRHPDRAKGLVMIRQLYDRLSNHPLANRVRFAGPAAAPLERLRARWRFQMLMRTADRRVLKKILLDSLPQPLPSEVIVDVDPYDVL